MCAQQKYQIKIGSEILTSILRRTADGKKRSIRIQRAFCNKNSYKILCNRGTYRHSAVIYRSSVSHKLFMSQKLKSALGEKVSVKNEKYLFLARITVTYLVKSKFSGLVRINNFAMK